MKTINPLPLKLRKNGFNYSQVLRGKRACIYSQEVSKTVTYYEVFKIKVIPERKIKGKIIEAHEKFPHDEAFGYWAWSYRDYDRALEKFNKLENTKNIKVEKPNEELIEKRTNHEILHAGKSGSGSTHKRESSE